MLRAIIVDDEILVRATLEKMVDWAAEGFQLAGCYANGQAALEAMEPVSYTHLDVYKRQTWRWTTALRRGLWWLTAATRRP